MITALNGCGIPHELHFRVPVVVGLRASMPQPDLRDYRIMPDGDWAIADTTPDTKITLAGQPKAKTLEYCVFARNKAGDGLVSNVIEVVL